ncbi:MAG: DUF1028 domain-containing protein [Rhodospirillales bacterium]
MTFSILGRCEATGMIGVAVTSSWIAAGSNCPRVRPGVGAAIAQHYTDPRVTSAALDALERGDDPATALGDAVDGLQGRDMKQAAVIDLQGRTAVFHGDAVTGAFGDAAVDQAVALGNSLVGQAVVRAVADAFAASEGHLADRLLAALGAGADAGGEGRPLHSAGLLIGAGETWPRIDLRIDWSDGSPVEDLAALWERYRVHEEDQVRWAVNPSFDDLKGSAT